MNEIRQAKISELTPDPNNANQGTERGGYMVRRSLEKLGAGRSVLIDKNGVLIAGNKTTEAAFELGLEDAIIVPTDGSKLVVVQRTDLDLSTDAKAKELAIADNRTGEIGLAWDNAVLEELAQDVSLDDWFTPEEMAEWDVDLSGFEPPSDEEDEETTADLIEQAEEGGIESRVKLGEIWQLGRHRIACGDSTDEGNVKKLLEKNTIGALVFDPPWDAGISIDQFHGYPSTLAFSDMQRISDIIKSRNADLRWLFVWDCVSSWYTPSSPLKRGKCCLWYASNDVKYNFDGAHYGAPLATRMVSNTRGCYEFKGDERGKHLSDVFSAPITKLHSESEHKHSKPVDWVKMLVANCSTGNVFDPFLGSGTSIIVGEHIDRTVLGFELSPDYCEVIIRRWEEFTGGVAQLAGHL